MQKNMGNRPLLQPLHTNDHNRVGAPFLLCVFLRVLGLSEETLVWSRPMRSACAGNWPMVLSMLQQHEALAQCWWGR